MDPLSLVAAALLCALIIALPVRFLQLTRAPIITQIPPQAQPRDDRAHRSTVTSGLALPLLAFVLAGCAAKPQASCDTLSCWKQAAVEPIYEDCMRDLLFEDRKSQRERKRIRDTYAYPFTNASTYFGVSSGASLSLSPMSWCRRYADRYAQVTVARNPQLSVR